MTERDALLRIRDLTLDVPAAHGDPESYYLGQLRTVIGTAARALAASERPEGLDVERLARAVASAGVHIDVRDPLVRTEPCDPCARGVRVIAAEYARLSDAGERPYIAPPMQDWDKA